MFSQCFHKGKKLLCRGTDLPSLPHPDHQAMMNNQKNRQNQQTLLKSTGLTHTG